MRETTIEPHPYACQIKGCKGRIGQAIVELTCGSIRVCLYHDVLLKMQVLGAADTGRTP